MTIQSIVENCRAGTYAAQVARLESGWVVMGERQVFVGYCLLLPDPLVPHLNALSEADRSRFLGDMALLGDAILAAVAAQRINYALFGNADPVLHAHVFPRFADEPHATRALHPWAFDWDRAPEYAEGVHGDLKRCIAARLPVRHA